MGALAFAGTGTGLVELDYARMAAEVASGLAQTLAEENPVSAAA